MPTRPTRWVWRCALPNTPRKQISRVPDAVNSTCDPHPRDAVIGRVRCSIRAAIINERRLVVLRGFIFYLELYDLAGATSVRSVIAEVVSSERFSDAPCRLNNQQY